MTERRADYPDILAGIVQLQDTIRGLNATIGKQITESIDAERVAVNRKLQELYRNQHEQDEKGKRLEEASKANQEKLMQIWKDTNDKYDHILSGPEGLFIKLDRIIQYIPQAENRFRVCEDQAVDLRKKHEAMAGTINKAVGMWLIVSVLWVPLVVAIMRKVLP
jgi:hypothetical protein